MISSVTHPLATETPVHRSSSVNIYSYQKVDTVAIKYTKTNGDSLNLSAQSIELYQKAIEDPASLSDDDWKKLISGIKDEVAKMKMSLVNALTGGKAGGSDAEKVMRKDPVSSDMEIADVPEYWNAENTSQRIVDFALSFRGAFKGTDEEYLAQIKEAVEKGFNEAKGILGDLPKAVSNLTDATHELTMKKLDDWLVKKSDA